MGCDIHVYVEYSTDGKFWRNLTKNVGSRNYVMFGVLAGVRCEDVKLFDPKGMPEGRLGFYTDEDYWRRIAPSDHPEWADTDGYTSTKNAVEWINRGYSVGDYKNGALQRVSGPDWHSHSWLTADELDAAIQRYREVIGGFDPSRARSAPTEWLAILAAMQAVEENGDQARVVFWFDN